MVPKTKVFIGSLPPGSKPDELRRLFEAYGVVTECDVMNRCGFVHMQTEEMAFDAIKALHNTSFKGATISVERGRIKERGVGGPRRGGPGGPRGGGIGGFRGDRNGGPPGGPRNGGVGGGRMGGGGMVGAMRRGPPGGPGPMRGGPRDGGIRGAPYPPRDGGRDFDRRGGGGGPMRNGGGGGGFDRGEDRRGFALPDRRSGNGGGGYPGDDRGMYMDDRRPPPMMDDRRGGIPPMRPPMPMPPMFDRRPAPLGQMGGAGDMFSRRSPPQMRSGFGANDRGDSYSQAFPPLGGGMRYRAG